MKNIPLDMAIISLQICVNLVFGAIENSGSTKLRTAYSLLLFQVIGLAANFVIHNLYFSRCFHIT